MIGVDYDLFWTLNPKSLSPFIKAFKLRQEYDDAMAWNLGRYIQSAIGSVLSKSGKYPSKPFSSTPQAKEMTPDEIKQRVMNQMKLINARFGKEESNG